MTSIDVETGSRPSSKESFRFFVQEESLRDGAFSLVLRGQSRIGLRFSLYPLKLQDEFSELKEPPTSLSFVFGTPLVIPIPLVPAFPLVREAFIGHPAPLA
jgi:hypothetical protein